MLPIYTIRGIGKSIVNGGKIMKIDKLYSVQKSLLVYKTAKTASSVKDKNDSKRDMLTLTNEAQQFLTKIKEQRQEMRRQQSENSSKKTKGPNMSKCYKIAGRIGNGHKVPLKDLRYLKENAPELYKNAILFKKHNPHPKKYKSCLDKEDEAYMREKQNSMLDVSVGASDAMVLNSDE